MRPMQFNKSLNLLYSNIVKRPVKLVCFILSYFDNLIPYNHVTITETSYYSFI